MYSLVCDNTNLNSFGFSQFSLESTTFSFIFDSIKLKLCSLLYHSDKISHDEQGST